MRVLVVGSGAREHALSWKLSASEKVEQLFAAPGNAGTARLGTNWPELTPTAGIELAQRAADERIDLAVIGSEAALAAGVSDALRSRSINVFGPSRAGARLESSKAFAKQFMERNGIPTSRYRIAHDRKQAERALAQFEAGVVLKADGLAAGKGVVVCAQAGEAQPILAQWYDERKLPGGGTTIVIEELLEGREVSVMAVLDGVRSFTLAGACDYKRAGDADAGPNTGGMGAYSPAQDVLDDVSIKRVHNSVLRPALEGLKREGIDYRGCLYAGIMMTARGPMVLEFNARFGDPETQVVLPRMNSDLFDLLYAASVGQLKDSVAPHFAKAACVGVVLTSDGYPQASHAVAGLPSFALLENESTVGFWGASSLAGDRVNANGGRVITVCALGEDMACARRQAYEAVSKYERMLPPRVVLRYRSDIAARLAEAVR
ncbi:MAG: phosphoribosylamine--glycine ligase [Candidatus Eremiobacteraeota bacterium]|nr:phosphoribosylamine--glycine ligase [Candidatus Eremiobacteraeota bacterium]